MKMNAAHSIKKIRGQLLEETNKQVSTADHELKALKQ